MIKEKELEGKIKFSGSILYKNIVEFYKSGNLFVNFSKTGSLDKSVLEAMASGLLILTSNEAFKKILSEKYFVNKIENPKIIADKIQFLLMSAYDYDLRDYVVKNHNLNHLMAKIISLISSKK